MPLTYLKMLWLRFGPRPSDRGATLVEYALLLALIAVVCILAVVFFGSQLSTKFSSEGNQLS